MTGFDVFTLVMIAVVLIPCLFLLDRPVPGYTPPKGPEIVCPDCKGSGMTGGYHPCLTCRR